MIRRWNFFCLALSRLRCGFAWFSGTPSAALYSTGVIFKADSDLSNLLGAPRGPRSRGRGKLPAGRASDNKRWQISQNKPVLPSRAKALLKRFFWGALNVVKWSPLQLGHSKRPSLTTRAKQTPSPLPRPCQFSLNPLGLDPESRYPTAQGNHIKTPLHLFFFCLLSNFSPLIVLWAASHSWINSYFSLT